MPFNVSCCLPSAKPYRIHENRRHLDRTAANTALAECEASLAITNAMEYAKPLKNCLTMGGGHAIFRAS
jgi:hypothetical protein